MPAITSGRVFVTGGNGFLASWVIDTLLKQGFRVRTVVRSAEKGTHIPPTFAEYRDKLEVVVVEDFTLVSPRIDRSSDVNPLPICHIKEGAFDEVIEGVDAIMHVASPVRVGVADDPNDVIKSAVDGTTSLLKSVISRGVSVKRFIYTTTSGTICSPSAEPKTFNENDWNDWAIQYCKERGADADPPSKYIASKTLAERAVWEIYEQHRAEHKWDLVVIAPPWIFGPNVYDVPNPADLNLSMIQWHRVIFKTELTHDELFNGGYAKLVYSVLFFIL